jgi:hypothetical protein
MRKPDVRIIFLGGGRGQEQKFGLCAAFCCTRRINSLPMPRR